jgi:hypothetical protein
MFVATCAEPTYETEAETYRRGGCQMPWPRDSSFQPARHRRQSRTPVVVRHKLIGTRKTEPASGRASITPQNRPQHAGGPAFVACVRNQERLGASAQAWAPLF